MALLTPTLPRRASGVKDGSIAKDQADEGVGRRPGVCPTPLDIYKVSAKPPFPGVY
jgi:hypothetical protein